MVFRESSYEAPTYLRHYVGWPQLTIQSMGPFTAWFCCALCRTTKPRCKMPLIVALAVKIFLRKKQKRIWSFLTLPLKDIPKDDNEY